jgi:hypothetical protein
MHFQEIAANYFFPDFAVSLESPIRKFQQLFAPIED